MSWNRRVRSLVVLAAAAGGLLGVSASPGSARTPLSIDQLYCQPSGWGTMSCTATVSGGTGSYTYTWRPAPYNSGELNPGEPYMTAPCSLEYLTPASLTVTDGSTTVIGSTSVDCRE